MAVMKILLLCCYIGSACSLFFENLPKIPLSQLESPKFIKIKKYFIDFDVFIEEKHPHYTGNVQIEFTLEAQTKTIDIHATSFYNLSPKLYDVYNNKEYNLTKILLREKDVLLLNLPENQEMVLNRTYVLKFSYMQFLRNDSIGFFYTDYNGPDKTPVRYAATFLQPSFARLVFPCFDEPALKASFVITITHANKYNALSNEQEYKRVHNETSNRTKTIFMTTPLMSTYNLAIVVSDFKNASITDENDVEHRVFYNQDYKFDVEKSLNYSVEVMNLLNVYFEDDYPLTKIDHFPLKRKSMDLAFESWGLITYSEKLMIKPNRISMAEHMIEIHELVHQWIGNLITSETWPDLWINEGFTTYFSYKIIDLLHPSWDYSRKLISKINDRVFNGNGMSVIPNYNQDDYLINDVSTTDFFNTDIYEKTAGIIKMFNDAIGDGIMLKLFKTLINANNLTLNTKQVGMNLHWQINKLNNSPFKYVDMPALFETWLKNVGYAKITVQRNYINDTVTFIIESKINDNNLAVENKEQSWIIPLTIVSKNNPNFTIENADLIIGPDSRNNVILSELKINVSTDDWLIVNKQQSGIFSVIYDAHNTKLISNALVDNHTIIHPLNRALLFRDFELNLHYIDNIQYLITAFTYLSRENDLDVVANACKMMTSILIKLRETIVYEDLKTYLRNFTETFFNKFYANQQTKRKEVIQFLGEIEEPTLLELLKSDDYDSYQDDEFICIYFGRLNNVRLTFVLERMLNIDSYYLFDEILYFSRCIKNKTIIYDFITFFYETNFYYSIDGGIDYNVNSNKLSYIVRLYKSNPNARHVIIKFLLKHYENYLTDSGEAQKIINNLTKYVPESQEILFSNLVSGIKKKFAPTKIILNDEIGSSIKLDEIFAKKHINSLMDILYPTTKKNVTQDTSTITKQNVTQEELTTTIPKQNDVQEEDDEEDEDTFDTTTEDQREENTTIEDTFNTTTEDQREENTTIVEKPTRTESTTKNSNELHKNSEHNYVLYTVLIVFAWIIVVYLCYYYYYNQRNSTNNTRIYDTIHYAPPTASPTLVF